MEGAFTIGLASGWSISGVTATQETVVPHLGISAQKLSVSGGCGPRIEQTLTLTAGDYVLTGWAKRQTGSGTLPVYLSGIGNTSFTIGRLGPNFLGVLPYSSAFDLKIDPTDTDSLVLFNNGLDLGTDNSLGLNSSSIQWPLNLLNQNEYGTGWDLGAFVYYDPRSSSKISSSQIGPALSRPEPPSCGDQKPYGVTDLFQVDRAGSTAKLYFTPAGNATRYNVIFGYTNGDERFGGVSLASQNQNQGVQSILVDHLNPRSAYAFKILPVNGCAVGLWSNWLSTKGTLTGSRKSSFFRYF
jgi:hypothetical protein